MNILTLGHQPRSSFYPAFRHLMLNLAALLAILIAAGYLADIFADSATAQDIVSPTTLMQQGQTSYQQGAFTQALQYWMEAEKRFGLDGKVGDQIRAEIGVSQALYQMGHYKEAGSVLTAADKRSDEIGDRLLKATVQGRLAAVLFALGDNEQALRIAEEGLVIARRLNHSALAASLLNDQGNILTVEKRFSSAVSAYTESSILAKASNQQALAAIALINAGRATTLDGAFTTAKARLDLAAQEVQAMPKSFEQANAWLSLGDAYEDVFRPRPNDVSSRREMKKMLLAAKGTRGAELQPGAGAPAGSSEAGESKTEQALPEKAPSGEPAEAPPSRPEPGRPSDLFSPLPSSSDTRPDLEQGTLRQAAEAYWNAIQVATAIGEARTESYGWGHLGHLYEINDRTDEALDLTRRALLAAQRVRSPESLYRWHWQTGRLLRSKGRVEEAIQAYQRAIETLQPIRSEFLVGARNRQFSFRETTGNLFFELSDLLLQRASITTEQAARQRLLTQAQDTVELFKAAELQDYFRDECVATARSRSTEVAQESRTTAIIYPIVLANRVELLASLPTGLKQYVIPIASDMLTEEVRAFRIALEDRSNDSYLPYAQKLYDWLIRPMEADLAADHIATLVFVPDGPLRTVPMTPLHDGTHFLVERFAVATTPGLTLTDPRPLDRRQVRLFSVGLTQSVQGFPPLPYVAKELNAIQSVYSGKQLLNEEFRTAQVEQNLKEEPYNMVHIASHGKVESDVTKSFVLTFDDRLTMDRLSRLVGMFEYRTAPLELLTLSACETAAGDDRAALGLAGMAIKAGAKSALATLWFIDDEATAELVTEFYKNLQDPTLSKAMALQRAQLVLLQNPERSHPSLWAPFLLINNWL